MANGGPVFEDFFQTERSRLRGKPLSGGRLLEFMGGASFVRW